MSYKKKSHTKSSLFPLLIIFERVLYPGIGSNLVITVKNSDKHFTNYKDNFRIGECVNRKTDRIRETSK